MCVVSALFFFKCLIFLFNPLKWQLGVRFQAISIVKNRFFYKLGKSKKSSRSCFRLLVVNGMLQA